MASTKLAHHRYGKAANRLVRIVRESERHEIRDLTVDIALHGDFERCYTEVRQHGHARDGLDEERGLCARAGAPHRQHRGLRRGHRRELTATGPLVSGATVHLVEHPWTRLPGGADGHDHAWRRDSSGDHEAWVTWDGSSFHVEAGIGDLFVLKSTQSGWSDFQDDKFRTLAIPTTGSSRRSSARAGRIAPSRLPSHVGGHRGARRGALRRPLQPVGAGDDPPHLHGGPRSLRGRRGDHDDAPNRHHLRYDLAPFGQENPGVVFVATSEPYGLIEATVTRA